MKFCKACCTGRVGEELQFGVLASAVVEGPVVTEEDDRQVITIAKDLAVIGAFKGTFIVTFAIDPASVLEAECAEVDLDVVLVFKAELEDFKLEDTNGTHDSVHVTEGRLSKDLDCTFFGELVETFDELFTLEGILDFDDREVFWTEAGDIRRGDVCPGADGVADAEDARVIKAEDIASISFFKRGAAIRHEALRVSEFDLSIGAYEFSGHIASVSTRCDAHKGESVAVCRVHIRLNFKDKCAEFLLGRIDDVDM